MSGGAVTTLCACIEHLPGLVAFRSDVRAAMVGARLPPRPREEVLVVLTELGTNLIHHGGGGGLEVELRPSGDETLVVLRATNASSAPSPPSEARRPGLGIGIDSLRRLMDEVEVSPREPFQIQCTRRIGRRPAPGAAKERTG